MSCCLCLLALEPIRSQQPHTFNEQSNQSALIAGILPFYALSLEWHHLLARLISLWRWKFEAVLYQNSIYPLYQSKLY